MSDVEFMPAEAHRLLVAVADGESVPDEQFDAAVRAAPSSALAFALDFLSDAQFAFCAAAASHVARDMAPERYAALYPGEPSSPADRPRRHLRARRGFGDEGWSVSDS